MSIDFRQPYLTWNEREFVEQMKQLTRHHVAGCDEFARLFGDCGEPAGIADLPYLHVGVFKNRILTTRGVDRLARVLESSSTSGRGASQISLDKLSADLQRQSSRAILTNFLGEELRPLLVLDSASALRKRALSARMAAAFSLQPLSTEMHFVGDANGQIDWDRVLRIVVDTPAVYVYGFTTALWTAWANTDIPDAVRDALRRTRITFVHSGGWKRLTSAQVDRQIFDNALLLLSGPGSSVLEFYGLVEQIGVIYPLCQAQARHVPHWAGVVVRDPWDHRPLPEGEAGQLQLINQLAYGAPYHSVLTEDMGRMIPGACPCGRSGLRFEMIGRIPNAELRGCANV